MKTTTKLALLLVAMLPTVATAQSAKTPPEGKAYTIRGTTASSSGGTPTYQWYRGDVPITNATDVSYTVPANEAYGTNVVFKRRAECGGADEMWSNPVLVSFVPDLSSKITGSTSVCLNSGVTYLTYSIINVAGTTYNWTVPQGWTITAGQGTNVITVTAAAISGEVSVTPTSIATGHVGTTRTLAVTTAAALTSSSITGSASVCPSQAGITYSVNNIAGATYNWSVPQNWTITAGQATNSITVTAGSVGGTISVTLTSACGSATQTLAVSMGSAPSQPSIITGSTYACPSQAGITYSVTNVAGVTYNWSVPGGWTITAGQNTSSITATAGSSGGNISVTPTSACGGSGAARTLAVSVSASPAPSSTIVGSAYACPNQTGITYSVTGVAGVSYTWAVPQGWTITSGQNTNSITATSGAESGMVSVTPSACGSSGTASTLMVNMGATPSTPSTISTSTSVICPGQAGITYTATLYNNLGVQTAYDVAGVTLNWTVPAGWTITEGQGTYRITVTAGTLGGIVSVTPSACGNSAPPRTLTAKVAATPTQPSTITASTATPCNGQAGITYSVTNVAGVTYDWSVPAGWSITAGQNTNSITATAGSASGVVVATPQTCGQAGGGRALAVTVDAAPAQPSAITPSATTLCNGQADITYTVTNVAGVSYAWTAPGGWNITAGQGTNSITVTAGNSSGNIEVTPSACGSNGTARTLAVAVGSTPAQPNSITASTTAACAGQTGITYSVVPNVPGVSYNWSVPSGWSITAGSNTNSITATAGANGNNGNVSVTPSTTCGGNGTARTLAVTVGAAPAQPSTIIGNTTPCPEGENFAYTYSVSSVQGVTYTWSPPTYWAIKTGQGSNSVTIHGIGNGTGTISVTPYACGVSGTARTLTILPNTAPAQPSAIVGSASVCPSQSGITYSVTNVQGVSYAWSVPAGWSITAGQGNNSITATAGSAGGTVSVTSSTSCGGNGTARTTTVSIQSAPTQPTIYTYDAQNTSSGFPASTAFCSGQKEITYTTGAGSATNTSYNWTVPAGWAITAGQGTNVITITAGSSNGNVSVTPTVCSSLAGTPATLAVTASACGAACGGGNGTTIAGLCWANRNVAASGTFAGSADMYTEFYQFNRNTAYSATDPVNPSWTITSIDDNFDWQAGNDPCPVGWRLPTKMEFLALHSSSTPIAGTWAVGGYRGVSSGIEGRFLGPNHATCTISDLSGCVFLPASGYRSNSNGVLNQGSGYYWTATQVNNNNGYYRAYASTSSNPESASSNSKAYGYNVRCVQ